MTQRSLPWLRYERGGVALDGDVTQEQTFDESSLQRTAVGAMDLAVDCGNMNFKTWRTNSVSNWRCVIFRPVPASGTRSSIVCSVISLALGVANHCKATKWWSP